MSSDTSSSDDDDVPLAALATSKTKQSTSKQPSRSSTSRSSSRRNSAPAKSYKEDSASEAEFDDDFEEVKPKPESRSNKRKASETSGSKKKTAAAASSKKKDKTETKKKPAAKKNSKKSESSNVIISASSELYAKSKKGKLISEFLCRWWYAMSWPDLEKHPIETPPNCDTMDGFPGVFVVTSGDDVGKIIDKRNKDTCPCFINMAKKPSEELKALLLKAIEEQRRILIEKEGIGTQTEKDLMTLEKWTNKVNTSSADKEAKKVLKAANMKI